MSSERVEIIIIDDAGNQAEALISILRNSGLALHTRYCEGSDDLVELLEEQTWDIVISRPESPYINAKKALSIIAKHQPALGLVILCQDDKNQELIIDIINAGAQDVVSLKNEDFARHTILRERANTRVRAELQQLQTALNESNHRAQTLVTQSKDAIAYVHEGMHIYANETYLQLFGYKDFDELMGMPIMDMLAAEKQSDFKNYLRDFTQGKVINERLQSIGVDQSQIKFDMEMALSNVIYESESCIQIIIYDKENNEELEQRLEELSRRDTTTGAYNRQYFLETVAHEVKITNSFGALLMIVADHYSQISQRYGFSVNDSMAQQIFEYIQSHTTSSMMLARFGSSRFVLLAKGISNEEATALAEKIVTQASDFILDFDGKTANTTFSIGVSVYDSTMREYQELVTRAEKVSSQLNSNGGNKFAIFIPKKSEMDSKERTKHTIRAITQALRDNSLLLYYQPIISLKEDMHSTYEVMLRMVDPEDESKFITSQELFQAAELANISMAIDRWVIASAVRALIGQRRVQRYPRLFIKLSENSVINHGELLGWLAQVVESAKIRPGEVVFEISERVAGEQLNSTKLLQKSLAKLQLDLAINQFGEAVDCYNIMRHCRPSFVKLSSQLINNMASQEGVRKKVNDITSLTKKNQIPVIANAVEDPQTLSVIYSTGIEYIVGFFIQKPSPSMDYDFTADT